MAVTATSRRHVTRAGLLAGLAVATLAATAGAQAPRGFFTEPSLILAGPGHTAPVRSLIFATPNGSQLLSGGLDKQIHAWNLDVDRSRPARTLRPPLGRGSRGHVYAMALAPRPDAREQRFLAVAGHGVVGEAGEILLFRYPGLTPQGTGEIEAQLPVPAPDGSVVPGHTDVVNALAFSPDGRLLASASVDGTVRIWEPATRRHLAAMTGRVRGQVAPINTVGFTPDGRRVVAGGVDGVLRLWDVSAPAAPRLLVEAQPEGDAGPVANQILSLAVSPDGRWVVVGREGGRLLRFDAATLANAVLLPEARGTGGTSGPMEAVAISPDGTRLATAAMVSSLASPASVPDVACDVLVRSMPDGRVVRRFPRSSNLVRALAFSPDGRRLAYSGGDAQGVIVQDLADPAVEVDEMKGNGSSLWDVGFRADGRAIRFARRRPDRPGGVAPADYETFDLRARHFDADAGGAAEYRHARAADQGWTITPTGLFALRASNGPGPATTLTLDPVLDRRWWSYTVIPPGPGRPTPLAAVASEAGVAIFTLPGGVRTHQFTGHNGPIYSVAASPDGRWLLTGSSDQTARLWPLAGADRPAPFGARFAKDQAGPWAVAEVALGGFADGIGLKPGDVVEKFFVNESEANPDAFLAGLDGQPPHLMFSFHARRPGAPEILRVGATKRQSPALTLFPGVDRQWVLWTPEGYYDTSAAGDRDSIGWLTNQGAADRLLAGIYDPIDRFEARYRQRRALPNVIDRLLDTADPVAALAALPPADPAQADPTTSRVSQLTIRPTQAAPDDRPVVASGPGLGVRYAVQAAQGAAKIASAWVEVNGRKVQDLVAGPPVQGIAGQAEIPVGGTQEARLRLVVVDEKRVQRAQALDLASPRAPEPTQRPARLEILAIGADRFADPRLPAISHAENDARDLAQFLGRTLVDPGTNARFRAEQVRTHRFVGAEAACAPILDALEALRAGQADGPPAAGDVVAVVIESHFLKVGSRALVASPEARAIDDPASASLAADDLAARLGELSRLGCRVVVMVDAVHGGNPPGWQGRIEDWVRRLQAESRVVAFVASDHGPSLDKGDGHRAFAQGVLDVTRARSSGRTRKASGPMSLFDAQRTIVDSVLALTGRRQHAQCTIPDTLPPQAAFFDPGSPR